MRSPIGLLLGLIIMGFFAICIFLSIVGTILIARLILIPMTILALMMYIAYYWTAYKIFKWPNSLFSSDEGKIRSRARICAGVIGTILLLYGFITGFNLRVWTTICKAIGL